MATTYREKPPSRRGVVRVEALASRQYGLVCREQALRSGLSSGSIQWRLDSGLWRRVHPGVYAVRAWPSSWRQRVLAECLHWGPDAYASHRSSAALWRLVGSIERLIELTVPRDRRRKRYDAVIHRTASLAASDRAFIEGIPVTGMARTLIDLAAVVARDELEEALDDGLSRGLVRPDQIRRRLDALGRPRGAKTMRALLEARDPAMGIPRLVFESRLLRILKRAGLPEPQRQHEVRHQGRLISRLDFAWPNEKVGLEADSYRWHADLRTWEKDRWKDHELTLLDWKIRRVTWSDLQRAPDDVIEWTRRALQHPAH